MSDRAAISCASLLASRIVSDTSSRDRARLLVVRRIDLIGSMILCTRDVDVAGALMIFIVVLL